MSNPPPASPSGSSGRGRGWAIAGILSGLLAVVLVPILFGPLGVLFGIVGYVKCSRRAGIAAVVVGVLGFVVGIALTAFLLSAFG